MCALAWMAAAPLLGLPSEAAGPDITGAFVLGVGHTDRLELKAFDPYRFHCSLSLRGSPGKCGVAFVLLCAERRSLIANGKL